VATLLRQEVGSHSGPTKRISSLFFRFFHFFRYFSHFFSFFLLFLLFFALNFSLRFDLVIFLRSEAKFKSIFSLFLLFFHFFSLFSLIFPFFSLNFCFASIFSLNFCLFYLRFRFRFLVFRIEVNHVKSGFFSLPSETKFSRTLGTMNLFFFLKNF
jgi:hypothetical protein